MFTTLTVLALIAAIGCWLTERVDRPRRRQERLARPAIGHTG